MYPTPSASIFVSAAFRSLRKALRNRRFLQPTRFTFRDRPPGSACCSSFFLAGSEDVFRRTWL